MQRDRAEHGRPTPPRRGPGRPASRSVEQVVDAAVALLDRVGLDGVSMDAVATELGSSRMGLYRYVDSKDHLLSLIPDRLLTPVVGDVLATASGLAALRAVAAGVGGVLQRHPNAAPLLARPEPGPQMQTAARHAVALLIADGAAAEESFEMLRAVVAQVVGEHLTSHGGPGSLGVEWVIEGIARRIGRADEV